MSSRSTSQSSSPSGSAAGAPFRPIDVSAWIGAYPFRPIPHPDPATLVRVLEREGFGGAWVGSLDGAFHRDPTSSNKSLFEALKPHRDVLHPAPMVRPDWPAWERQFELALHEGAPAVRVYPAQWGLGAGHGGLAELAMACGEAGIAMHVTVRFEDLRQRHPMDQVGDVSAAVLRAIARVPGSHCHLVVAGAARELIEETHWGLTEEEQRRVFFDFHWVWGPPEDHFAHLVRTIGPHRLAWSSWWPLRLTQQSRALVDLLPPEVAANMAHTEFADGASISRAAHLDSVGTRSGGR